MRRLSLLSLVGCVALFAPVAGAEERGKLIAAAREAMDRLPHREGNREAGDLLDRALSIDSSDAEGGFTLAMRLRERMMLELDVGNGAPFFDVLRRLYPHDETLYRTERARLLVNAGRLQEGAGEYAALLAEDPGNVEVALALADAQEVLGHTAKALAVCEEIIRRTGAARAHLHHGRFLLRHGDEGDAAGSAFAAARISAKALPPEERSALLAEVSREEEGLRAVVRRRLAVRRHLRRLDRILIAVGAGWLVLLAGGGWFLRRKGWI